MPESVIMVNTGAGYVPLTHEEAQSYIETFDGRLTGVTTEGRKLMNVVGQLKAALEA